LKAYKIASFEIERREGVRPITKRRAFTKEETTQKEGEDAVCAKMQACTIAACVPSSTTNSPKARR
jgi:hypothetical protein